MERSVLFKSGIDDVYGAAAVIGIGPSSFEVYGLRTIRHTRFIDHAQLDTHPVELF
jgi:hypothetical protein